MTHRSLAAILALLILGIPAAVQAAEPRISHTAQPRVSPRCTHTLGLNVDSVDASKEDFADVGPGSVLCLEPGRRGNLKLANLHGTAEAPIIVRNHRGRVTIRGASLEAGIKVLASTYVRITGAGTQARCGALYATAAQRCGIQIDGAIKGVKMSTTKGPVGHVEIDHVAVLRVTDEKQTRGILIHPVPGHVVVGLYVHHNYVANTGAEAIYLGTEPHGMPFADLAKLRSVEVSYNRIENIGFDGIKIKVAIADVFVHHNVISNVGMSRTKAHQGGIKVASSVGHFFNNTVVGAVEGIRMGRPLPGPETRYYNNLVANVLDVGIDAPEPGARVYNNTVVDSQGLGIKVTGPGSFVENNIIAGAGEPLKVRDAVLSGNLVAAAADEVGFASISTHDYRLTAASPAVDVVPAAAALNCDVEVTRFPKLAPTPAWPLFDRDDHSRPAGCEVDLGAYEFGSSTISGSSSRR